MTDEALDLATTYLRLEDGPAAHRVPTDAEFWTRIAERADLAEGRLVTVFPMLADWRQYEMHPAGDEVVVLLSGAVTFVLEEAAGERRVALKPHQACVVPRGVWHRAIVDEPGAALFITRGAGTQHRPL